MSKGCRHRLRVFQSATVFAPHTTTACIGTFGPGWANVPGQHRCDRCGQVIPLGESNDADERVRMELRAARLAHGENNEHEFTQIEWCGWSGDEIAIDGSTREEIDVTAERGWDVGYLAAVIADLGHAERP